MENFKLGNVYSDLQMLFSKIFSPADVIFCCVCWQILHILINDTNISAGCFLSKNRYSSLKTGCLRKCLCFSQIHFWFWEVCGVLSLLCVSGVNSSPPLLPSQWQISAPLCTYLVLATFSHSKHWKLFPFPYAFPYAVRLCLHSLLKTYQEKMCFDCQILN